VTQEDGGSSEHSCSSSNVLRVAIAKFVLSKPFLTAIDCCSAVLPTGIDPHSQKAGMHVWRTIVLRSAGCVLKFVLRSIKKQEGCLQCFLVLDEDDEYQHAS
jgi:hypothetical protein